MFKNQAEYLNTKWTTNIRPTLGKKKKKKSKNTNMSKEEKRKLKVE